MNRYISLTGKWLLLLIALLALGAAPVYAEDALPAPTISVSGTIHNGDYFCPGAELTVTAEGGLQSVTIGGESQAVSGDTFTAVLKAAATSSTPVEIVAVGQNGQTASKTIKVSHGSLTRGSTTTRFPTCTEPGAERDAMFCMFCGGEIAATERSIPALGHSYVPIEKTENMCAGTATEVCSRCGEPKEGTLGEHSFGEPVETPATCGKPGQRTQTCVICGYVKTAEIPATGAHQFDEWTFVPATCTQMGRDVRTCSVCGQQETKRRTDALGHAFKEEIVKPATCMEDGVKKRTCTRCGYVEENVRIPMGAHLYQDVVDQAPTCTASGTYHKECVACHEPERDASGNVRTYTSPAQGHDKQEGWVSNETAHWHTCSRCDSQLDFALHTAQDDKDCTTLDQCSVCGYVVSAASGGHKITFDMDEYNHWTTCENPGCNYKVPTTAHTFSAVDGDCTKGMACTVCGYQTLRYGASHAVNPILGWRHDDQVHYRACANPGCTVHVNERPHSGTDDGNCQTAVYCQACGIVITPAKTHDFGPWVHQDEKIGVRTCQNENCTFQETKAHETTTTESIDKPASCTEAGHKTVTVWCVGCQSAISVTKEEIPKLGHDWGDWKTVDEAGCTNDGAEQRVCSRCKLTETRGLNPNGHDWETGYTVDKAATCTEEGSESIHCKKCSATKDAKPIPELGHDHSQFVETVREATCLDDEIVRIKCTRCEDTVVQTMAGTALGHAFGAYHSNHDASCLKGETETARCTRCSAADTRPMEGGKPLGHLYRTDYDCTTADPCVRCGELGEKTDAHEPTGRWLIDAEFGTHYQLCAHPGCSQRALEESHRKAPDDGDCTTPVYCSVCGMLMETGNAYHQFGAWTDTGDTHTRACRKAGCTVTEAEAHKPSISDSNVDVMPDCTHGGHSTSRVYCEVCGGVYASENAELPPLGHDFAEYHISKEASCGKNAEETAKCTRCDATDTREIPDTALDHRFGAYAPDNNATCTKDGTETAKCVRCGATDTRTVKGSALGHSFEKYVSDGNATCTADGTETAKCARCDVTDTRTVKGSALGHSFEKYVSDGNATCTADGTETAKCARCDATDTRTVKGSALGHSFEKYVSDGNATCTEDGTETAKCVRCDVTDTRPAVGSALGHSFEKYVSDGNATCTEDGTETAKCVRCDATDTRTAAGSALGHTFETYVSDGNATCTEDGTETAKCVRCDVTDTRTAVGSALGHTFETYVSDGNATCTEDGTETAKCVRCDVTDTRTAAGSALGHWFGGWEPAGSGRHRKQCSVCGQETSEACAYSEMTFIENNVLVCRVCGDVIDASGSTVTATRFTVAENAGVLEAAPEAVPAGADLVVRVLETPFTERTDVLEAFTVCWEKGGVSVPFLGAVRIRLPLPLTGAFRLVRVDTVQDESGAFIQVETEIAFTYEDGALIFETDRDGLFLLVPAE